MTIAPPSPPPLRSLPLPVTEPQPALRLLPGRGLVDHHQDALEIDEDAWHGTASAGPVPARPVACLPEPREWATRFVQAAVEVAAGLRPAGQLVRWTTGDVQATLARRHQIAARLRRPSNPGGAAHRARVRTVLASCPCDGVLEVSAVVQDHERVRAVALRMEGVQSRWRVTAFELG